MVLRSCNNANTNGGVAYVNANNDSSNTNTNNGSRLANRKVKLKSAESAMMKKMRPRHRITRLPIADPQTVEPHYTI